MHIQTKKGKVMSRKGAKDETERRLTHWASYEFLRLDDMAWK